MKNRNNENRTINKSILEQINQRFLNPKFANDKVSFSFPHFLPGYCTPKNMKLFYFRDLFINFCLIILGIYITILNNIINSLSLQKGRPLQRNKASRLITILDKSDWFICNRKILKKLTFFAIPEDWLSISTKSYKYFNFVVHYCCEKSSSASW